MASAILRVLLILILIAYCALFITWNSQPVTVAGLDWLGDRYVQEMPLGYLPFIGAVAGALLMGIAVWSEWSQQKGRADRAAAQVTNAKAKLQELADIIKQHRQEIAELKESAEQQPTEE